MSRSIKRAAINIACRSSLAWLWLFCFSGEAEDGDALPARRRRFTAANIGFIIASYRDFSSVWLLR